VPNEKAMAGLDKTLIDTYPNLGMAPADLVKQEQLRDLGKEMKLYSKTVTEITASN
jgi:spermidine/putrescine transport system substrate-binding protein